MKLRFLLLWLLFFSCSGACASTPEKKEPEIVKGVLDLSAWDLEEDGPIELFGEFEFFWNQLLTPEDFAEGRFPPMSGYIMAPGSWNGHSLGNETLGSYGYGTYRVRVKLKPGDLERLGLKFSNEIGAFRVFVGDRGLIHAGVPGTTFKTTVPNYDMHVANFTPDDNTIDILIQVASFHAFLGGLTCKIQLGTEESISRIRLMGLALDLFFLGTIFFMGCYHLGLFVLWRDNKTTLYFGLLCMVASGYTLFVGEKFFFSVFPFSPWFVNFKLMYFFAYSLMFNVLTISHYLYEEDSSRRVVRVFQVVYLVCVFVELVTDSRFYTVFIFVYYAATLLGFLYIIYLGIIALSRRRAGSLVYLASYALSVSFTVNDMLYTQKIVDTGDFLPFAIVYFFFFHAYMIAYRFSQAMKAEEKLSGELKDLTNSLENRVHERTVELEFVNREIKLINEDLVSTRNHLWGEMKLAKKIQTILLPQKPSIPGYEISVYIETADEVGGDYYDVIHAGEMHWLVIGDVSGHGVPAGLIMMMAQTAIHTALSGKPDATPSELLHQVNKVLVGNIQKVKKDMYMTITVFACVKNGRFHFSGLHQDILVYRDKKQAVEVVKTTGIWLGLFDGLPNMNQDDLLSLDVGDAMLLYTDGITEAYKENAVSEHGIGEKIMFGEHNLFGLLVTYGKGPTEEIKDQIVSALSEYSRTDDVTFVIVKRRQ